MGSLKSPVKLT